MLRILWLIALTPYVALVAAWRWARRRMPDNVNDGPPVVMGQGDYRREWWA